ncbi:MAG: TIM barrel protein [Chloroflexi bacterium]|nr:TIM barrel protein [Chloroflexota bacterium]
MELLVDGGGISGKDGTVLRLSACIEMIFRDLPVEERIARVADAGLPAVEFWGWADKDLPSIAHATERRGLVVSSFAYRSPGDIVDRANHGAFLAHFDGVRKAADILHCRTVIVTVGQELPGVPRAEQHAAIVEALQKLAPTAEAADVTIVVEPLNVLINHKGYYLSTSDETFQILDEIGSPAIKALYDVYHQQITEGNIIHNITQHFGHIGHFHIADNPGRHEPGSGEINYVNVLRAIERLGYGGYVGLEYRPSGDDLESLRQTVTIAQRASA